MKDIRLWGILFLALGVRTVMLSSVFADTRRTETPDSLNYQGYAIQLGWAVDDFYTARRPCIVEQPVFRPPGYPVLLMGANWLILETWPRIAGSPSFALDSPNRLAALRIIVCFQILVDVHLVLLTFFLARSLVGNGVGLMAALFQSVSPLAAAASYRILPDALFAFVLTGAVVLLVRHFRTGGWWSLLAAALVMGVACYLQPVGQAFAAVMALVLVCRPKRIPRVAAFAGVVAACLAPWTAMNAIKADYWGFSSVQAESTYWWSAAEIENCLQKSRYYPPDVWDRYRKAEGWDNYDETLVGKPWLSDAPCHRTLGGLVRYRTQKAREMILAHPWEFVRIHLVEDMAFWLPGATDALEVMGYTTGINGALLMLHSDGLIAATRCYFSGRNNSTPAKLLAGVIGGITLICYLGVMLCGLWRLRPRMTAAGWLCLLLVLTAWLLPGPTGHPRFRVPVEPILSAAAAIGWLGLLNWFRRRRVGSEAQEKTSTAESV